MKLGVSAPLLGDLLNERSGEQLSSIKGCDEETSKEALALYKHIRSDPAETQGIVSSPSSKSLTNQSFTAIGNYLQANHGFLAHTFLIFNLLFNFGPCWFYEHSYAFRMFARFYKAFLAVLQ